MTERSFPHAPPLAGALEYHRADGERLGLAAVHGWLAKAESGWEYTLRALDRYYERVLSLATEGRKLSPVDTPLIQLVRQAFPAEVPELVGTYLESARLLGLRTAELHLALAADGKNPEFAPEPFTTYYQRSLYQTMRNTARHSLQKLRDELPRLPAEAQPLAQRVLDLESQLLKHFHSLLTLRVSTSRIRCHGDYGLGQVLHTGKDFVMVDFEGHPKQVMSERRIKRLVLRDVTGMLCSFHYAADMALTRQVALHRLAEDERHTLASWAGRLAALGERGIPEGLPRHARSLAARAGLRTTNCRPCWRSICSTGWWMSWTITSSLSRPWSGRPARGFCSYCNGARRHDCAAHEIGGCLSGRRKEWRGNTQISSARSRVAAASASAKAHSDTGPTAEWLA